MPWMKSGYGEVLLQEGQLSFQRDRCPCCGEDARRGGGHPATKAGTAGLGGHVGSQTRQEGSHPGSPREHSPVDSSQISSPQKDEDIRSAV